jgi:hypothetical protein
VLLGPYQGAIKVLCRRYQGIKREGAIQVHEFARCQGDVKLVTQCLQVTEVLDSQSLLQVA